MLKKISISKLVKANIIIIIFEVKWVVYYLDYNVFILLNQTKSKDKWQEIKDSSI